MAEEFIQYELRGLRMLGIEGLIQLCKVQGNSVTSVILLIFIVTTWQHKNVQLSQSPRNYKVEPVSAFEYLALTI